MTQRAPPKGLERGQPVEVLAGTIERVTFHSPETGFCVLKVQARGRRDLVPVIGHAPAIGAGAWITATGLWHTDRQHGLQFKADTLTVTPPTGVDGIEKYLASGPMRGIGPAMAKRIAAAYGDGTFAIVEAEPGRLTEVEGIGPRRAARIVAGWAEQKAVRAIMLFLHAHGVRTARAVRIFRTYGHAAIAVMTEDPYRLAKDIRGIGFKTADAIAMKLGLTRDAPQRLRAGIAFALRTATDAGHCALPVAELVALVPAYAITIHKAQGSEYPAAVIPLATQHWPMPARNLLYTAVTRGKRLVVLLGQRRAVAVAVRGGTMKPRWTKLREWLIRAPADRPALDIGARSAHAARHYQPMSLRALVAERRVLPPAMHGVPSCPTCRPGSDRRADTTGGSSRPRRRPSGSRARCWSRPRRWSVRPSA